MSFRIEQALSYSTADSSGGRVSVRMRIVGRFDASYVRFVAHRAAWLSLGGWARNTAPGEAEIVATGPEVLIGALEMACLLGPLDALVETLDVESVATPTLPGFEVRA